MPINLLFMDDEPEELTPLIDYLRGEGYRVVVVTDANEAKKQILGGDFDVAVFDLHMASSKIIERQKIVQREAGDPVFVEEEAQGARMCAWAKASAIDIGTIILAKSKDVQEIVMSLDCGADTYIEKSQSTVEKAARIRSLCKLLGKTERDVVSFGDFELNTSSRKITTGGKTSIQLTDSEFYLLLFLLRNPRIVHSREKLYKEVFQREMARASDKAIDSLVSKFRKKLLLRDDNAIIQTVHGLGYLLDLDVRFK